MSPMRQDERNSALWGTGNRGGDSRGSALWGKGGRRAGLTLIAAIAAVMLVPWSAATASSSSHGGAATTFIPATLLSQAQANPKSTFQVIVQGDGTADADHVAHKIAAWAGHASNQDGDTVFTSAVTSEFSSIQGVAVTLTGRQLVEVASHTKDGILAITPDAAVHVSGTTDSKWSSTQLWPYLSKSANLWGRDRDSNFTSAMPSIAIVDSGIQADRTDFGNRVIASATLTSLPNNSQGDGRGHGTFVAGIAADGLPGVTGADPAANLVSLDVMDDSGMGLTSDIIKACQWILDHKAQYNIKVANFSLHSSITAPFYIDPLDRAVEQLWFNGVTVVVASGNYGSAAGPSGVRYSPGDDPFVITVGAADVDGSADPKKASVAPWSAWGYTIDGFAKPELSAPGRYMIGPVPSGSTLVSERPGNVTTAGYMQLSGTSFAAPVVAGAAANILAAHPTYTPDQVKGALMLTAKGLLKVGGAGGVGTVQAVDAVAKNDPPNANLALDSFLKSSLLGGGVSFDAASWNSAALASASWDSASWDSASWNSASWDSASWNSASWDSASWDSASWDSASWNDASWDSASWNDASREDAAEGDAASDPTAFTLTPADLTEMLADPTLTPDPTTLPPTLVTTTSLP
jgi:serine protease AprX